MAQEDALKVLYTSAMSLPLLATKRYIPKLRIADLRFSAAEAATAFRVGDPVFGFTGAGFGAYAEFVCLPETGLLASKPASMSYQEAAAVSFGALTALYFLRDLAQVQAGQKVLVYGASGGMGTAAVQIARSLGAHVTGVCSTAKKLPDRARNLPARRR